MEVLYQCRTREAILHLFLCACECSCAYVCVFSLCEMQIWESTIVQPHVITAFPLQNGGSALFAAVRNGQHDVLKILIEAGANVNQEHEVSTKSVQCVAVVPAVMVNANASHTHLYTYILILIKRLDRVWLNV